ncbi:hypothetical protein FGO68_gene13702 [Halteria grandinella]|uniref:Uncharacterized protein n=1 Tax=Halteria grandinella TaxID=5974 RepID=A0A8J8P6J4_HALGN|nr:hypothetical protein FGO68_gene13702 [Halteria grandinella]
MHIPLNQRVHQLFSLLCFLLLSYKSISACPTASFPQVFGGTNDNSRLYVMDFNIQSQRLIAAGFTKDKQLRGDGSNEAKGVIILYEGANLDQQWAKYFNLDGSSFKAIAFSQTGDYAVALTENHIVKVTSIGGMVTRFRVQTVLDSALEELGKHVVIDSSDNIYMQTKMSSNVCLQKFIITSSSITSTWLNTIKSVAHKTITLDQGNTHLYSFLQDSSSNQVLSIIDAGGTFVSSQKFAAGATSSNQIAIHKTGSPEDMLFLSNRQATPPQCINLFRFKLASMGKALQQTSWFQDSSTSNLQLHAMHVSDANRVVLLLYGPFQSVQNQLVLALYKLNGENKVLYTKAYSPLPALDKVFLGVFASETEWYLIFSGNKSPASSQSFSDIQGFILTSNAPLTCAVVPPVYYEKIQTLNQPSPMSQSFSMTFDTNPPINPSLASYSLTDIVASQRTSLTSCTQATSILQQPSQLPDFITTQTFTPGTSSTFAPVYTKSDQCTPFVTTLSSSVKYTDGTPIPASIMTTNANQEIAMGTGTTNTHYKIIYTITLSNGQAQSLYYDMAPVPPGGGGGGVNNAPYFNPTMHVGIK